MFPTISDLIRQYTGWQFPLPLQTFGTFVALGFVAAYWAYGQEFKRKEANGVLQKTERTTATPVLLYALLAGLFVFKLIPSIIHYRSFVADPTRILFSGVGNWPMGIAAGFFTGFLLWKGRKHRTESIHPYQLMPDLLWWCGITGFAGAVLFNILEIGTGEGVTYYGGLLFGSATALFIAYKHKIPLVHMADMGSPAMMLAYGVGRFGCHLSGDGDWGIVNSLPQPKWLSFMPQQWWAYNYPTNNEAVFPTSLYEGIICLCLFALLWFLRKRISTPGILFSIYCVLNGTERLLIEQIKINPIYGIGITQAELIGTCIILTGLVCGFIYCRFDLKKLLVSSTTNCHLPGCEKP